MTRRRRSSENQKSQKVRKKSVKGISGAVVLVFTLLSISSPQVFPEWINVFENVLENLGILSSKPEVNLTGELGEPEGDFVFGKPEGDFVFGGGADDKILNYFSCLNKYIGVNDSNSFKRECLTSVHQRFYSNIGKSENDYYEYLYAYESLTPDSVSCEGEDSSVADCTFTLAKIKKDGKAVREDSCYRLIKEQEEWLIHNEICRN